MTSLTPGKKLDKTEITRTIINCVADSLAIDTDGITLLSRLISDLGADSLDFMDIMFHFEDQFKIKLQKEDLDLITRAGFEREQVAAEGALSETIKLKLKQWLPELPTNEPLEAIQLVDYLTIESLVIIIMEEIEKQHNKK